MKLRECKIYGQPRYPQVSRQRARGGESRRTVAEGPRPEFVANLAVKLLVERFSCRPIKPNHFECYDRTPAPPLWTQFAIRHSHLLPLLLELIFSRNNATRHSIPRCRRQQGTPELLCLEYMQST